MTHYLQLSFILIITMTLTACGDSDDPSEPEAIEPTIVEPTDSINLNIQANTALKAASSYGLQTSDVYVNAPEIVKLYDTFYAHAYADFNSDGNTDVLLSSGVFKSHDSYPFYLYLGDGTGVNANFNKCGGEVLNYECDSFTLAENAFPESYEGMSHPRKIIKGDFNNDGLMDAFVAGHGYDDTPYPGEAPVLLLNTGSGFTVEKYTEYVSFYHAAASADIDNDNDIDIFLLSSRGDTYLLINDGEANFTFNTDRLDTFLLEDNYYYTTELIDVDQDGYIDIFLGGNEYEGDVETMILWGDSTGTYSNSRNTILPAKEGFGIIIDMEAEDIDNDGDNDIILNRVNSDEFYEGFYIQVIENDGSREFLDKTSERISDNQGDEWRIWVHMQDLNNDGMLDIYTNNDHTINLRWLNNGAGVFIKQ